MNVVVFAYMTQRDTKKNGTAGYLTHSFCYFVGLIIEEFKEFLRLLHLSWTGIHQARLGDISRLDISNSFIPR